MNNKSLIIVLLLALVMGTFSSRAQQDAQYTQYMYNTVSINPAYAGSRGVTSITGLHRSQWVGLDGAPRTQTISIHAPINRSKIGIGLNITNDEIGPSDETYFDGLFSYTINVSEKGKLSFGAKAGAHLLNIDYSQLSFLNQGDATFQNNVDNQLALQLGAGVYYRTDKFYLGFSVPNFLKTEHYDSSDNSINSSSSEIADERLNYYIITGLVLDLNEDIKFKPAALGKIVAGAPIAVDITANFMFYEKLTLGAAYRLDAAFSGLVGFQLSETLFLGLGYDAETTKLSEYNDGSYEIMARFELNRSYDRMLTPRFF